MSISEALILGIVQGIAEFLPVSSSGHLVLLQKIFNIEEPSLIFDIMVHVGTLAAVCAVLWRDIWSILCKVIQPMTLFLLIATVPAVLVVLLFNDFINNAFSSGSLLGICFLTTSLLLVSAEIISRRKKLSSVNGQGQMKWHDALVIGLLQAVAILPGISRSGATISGGLFMKLERNFAARFSFLLSVPVILGALVWELKSLSDSGIDHGIDALPILVGTISAATVGFFAIKFMLKIISKGSLTWFSMYTAVLGVFVLIDQLGTKFFF